MVLLRRQWQLQQAMVAATRGSHISSAVIRINGALYREITHVLVAPELRLYKIAAQDASRSSDVSRQHAWPGAGAVPKTRCWPPCGRGQQHASGSSSLASAERQVSWSGSSAGCASS